MDSKKPQVFIVHGWASGPYDCWFPWLAKELSSRGLEVIAPQFPNPKEPDLPAWVNALAETVGAPSARDHFVGHSLGGHVIVSYLNSLPRGARVGGVVVVGSRVQREGMPRVDEEKVRGIPQEITAIFSDDDQYVPLAEAERWREGVCANTQIFHARGHFSRREGMTEFPEVRELILRMSGIKKLPDRVGAALVRGGKVLLVRRLWGGREYYAFPGGGIEDGETPRQAIEREIMEELQLAIAAPAPFLEIVNLGRRETFFLVRDFAGEPVKSAELLDERERGSHDLVWLTYDECANASALYPERGRRALLEELGGL